MNTVINPGGRPRLLDLTDQDDDGLRSAMDFDVVYSLADRRCQRCLEGRRTGDDVGESIALVKVRNARHPLGHLVTLCAAHVEEFEQRAGAEG